MIQYKRFLREYTSAEGFTSSTLPFFASGAPNQRDAITRCGSVIRSGPGSRSVRKQIPKSATTGTMPAGLHQHVLRLDIAMNYPLPMCNGHCVANFAKKDEPIQICRAFHLAYCEFT
jgi:hypothetical protein